MFIVDKIPDYQSGAGKSSSTRGNLRIHVGLSHVFILAFNGSVRTVL